MATPQETQTTIATTSDLFSKSEAKGSAILLIDASGSVTLTNFGNFPVFDKIRDVVKTLDGDDFRVIFWNSDQKNKRDDFKNGIFKLEFPVKKSTIDQIFTLVKHKITNNCLTFPHLGFDGIPSEWINPKEPTRIYYITDGQIGYGDCRAGELASLKTSLSESIRRLFKNYSNIQLTIITVEAVYRNFGEIESLERAAGSDVYKIVIDNKLTQYITKFISYSLNHPNGFSQINKTIPPAGFIPFGEKYFSELRMPDFIKYLSVLIVATPKEDDLVQIVQYLSSTVCSLTKDKPKKVRDDIIKMFCILFDKTSLDSMFVNFVLTDAVQKESEGTANVYAAYRSQLKNLYKQATELLVSNVRNAIGIREWCISLPIHDKIITGHSRLIDRNIAVNGKVYPNAGFVVNDVVIPILPMDYEGSSAMNEQCLRQWIRVLVSRMYDVDILGDIVIFIVLGLCLRVCLSTVEPHVKKCYRRLATIMLKKKRMNTNCTELERLEAGELPIPNNGKIESFFSSMNTVAHILGLKLQPLTIWYAMCLALENDNLINKQLIHCVESIEKDFVGKNAKDLLSFLSIVPIIHTEIAFECVLEYNCLITMDDTSATGGYRFLPHQTMSNSTCCAVYVLSEVGYNRLIANPPTSICPICYNYVTEANFTKVGPKPITLNATIFPEKSANIFTSDVSESFGGVKNNNSQLPSAALPSASIAAIKLPASNKKGTLVIMKGVVGSGKTSFSTRIKTEIEKVGGYCCVTGTDKYSKTGIQHKSAVVMVEQELRSAMTVNNDNIVCIIDTCGERSNGNVVFGVDFTRWKKLDFWPNLNRNNLEGYLCWSLRNVLNRGKSGPDSDHYLNPIDAGVDTCITVHRKKAEAHFGNKIPKIHQHIPSVRDLAISKINDSANAYQAELDAKMPINAQIENFMAGMKK